jgi:NADH-quinone oxidoreductase subunit I
MFDYFGKILSGFWTLCQGMAITLKTFFKPNVTLEYPDERWTMHERFRGRVDMPLDPVTGAHKCTLCMMCVKICPNGSLEITAGTNEAGKRVLDKYIYKLSTCTLCELCVESCNFDAIRMSQDYEMSTYDRQDLTLVLNEPYRWEKEKGWAIPSASPAAAKPAPVPAVS